ncbi:MAG: DUF2939 domain-containing protein [Anaerovibrio sp.]|uniref:DUF2939 domain-containing protein n=1 Tax=Anaerovibrio sp. TaxID=1872532 RepID=UPI0025F2F577|nr:DUF2939 domain-containing protein [Anaerovibrio sp.]MCR5175793.1 DUF2939 domain-containing protein [Anaerovibrio sp.]
MSSFVRSVKYRLLAALVILLVAAVGGIWWYAVYYTNTPEYTLKMVQEAIENHDKDKLHKYVDFEHFLDSASDDMLDGLVDANIPAVGDTKEAVSSFTRMFKTPIIMSLQLAVDNYVEYGEWYNTDSKDGNMPIDADLVVGRSGISALVFRNLESVAVDDANGTAVAKVKMFQKEAGEEYTFDIELVKTESGRWQVYEVTNLKAFIGLVNNLRRQRVKTYLDQSAEIMSKHDEKAAKIEEKVTETLAKGSLGSNATRQELKDIMQSGLAPEWKSRREDLEELKVPAAAGTLHRLRLKICDLHIDYATDYAKWMDDKNAATLRGATSSLKQAKTLEKEAELLTRQVNYHIQK